MLAKLVMLNTFLRGKTNPVEIRKAITLTGFDADDLKADPKAYASLDGCCKRKE